MKNKKIITLIFVLILVCTCIVIYFAQNSEQEHISFDFKPVIDENDNIYSEPENELSEDELLKVWFEIGFAYKPFLNNGEEYYGNVDIVAYVNKVPVNKGEIIERAGKIEALNRTLRKTWTTNPVEYIYYEKFEKYYGESNNIEISDEELDQYINYQKEGLNGQSYFEEYLKGVGVSKEEYWNNIDPKTYKQHLFRNAVRKHILEKITPYYKGIEKLSGDVKDQYINQFCKDNMKVKVKDKKFIELYNKNIE
ncbi:hypothetical protein JYG23_00825 [Sedimentibacter sp. zth1]|uniref:hypothetical protein n=1 Tax=Sedimentibacter sp. zth1 TaxID=2816908 RepID=UPI001A9393AA|nr:hypothetical protein [Sedimentibacter sp. zth1]QSX06043.1 hypothetical protein JYG23_00825 [Sedimentibacter sp. zth1]